MEETETGENIHRLFQEYNQLMIELKQKKPTNFDSIRDAVVSVDVQNSNSKSEKLSVPLFNRALINFPAQGANEQESHILTSLFVLILLSIQKSSENQEPSATSFLQQTKSKMLKSRRKTTEIKYVVPQRKTEACEKETERKNISRPLSGTASNLASCIRSESFECTKTDNYTPNQCSSSQQTDFDGIDHFRPSRQEQFAHNELLSMKLNPSTPEFQPTRTTYQETYHVKPPVTIPSLMSLKINKAVFNLAVNGRPYGSIVFELRPEYTFRLNRNEIDN